MVINSSGQTIFSFSNIEGIILGIGEKSNEVAGGESGMGRIGEGKMSSDMELTEVGRMANSD